MVPTVRLWYHSWLRARTCWCTTSCELRGGDEGRARRLGVSSCARQPDVIRSSVAYVRTLCWGSGGAMRGPRGRTGGCPQLESAATPWIAPPPAAAPRRPARRVLAWPPRDVREGGGRGAPRRAGWRPALSSAPGGSARTAGLDLTKAIHTTPHTMMMRQVPCSTAAPRLAD